jgi:hypothetical protein
VYLPVRPLCGNREHYGYEQECGEVSLKLEPGTYNAKWFSATTGAIVPISPVQGGTTWMIPQPPDWMDWALLLERAKA